MKKVLFISNVPAPYRIDFFNELGKEVDLTVLFEAKTTPFTVFNYNMDDIKNFKAVFLKEGDIEERKIDWNILRYLKRNTYDKVVVTNYAYYTEAIAILALKFWNIPYEMELDGGVLRKERKLVRALKQLLIRGATRYWSTGDQTDRFFHSYGVKEEKIVRYPFSSISEKDLVERPLNRKEKQAAKDRLGIPYEKVVLSVGQPLHRKGFDLLIRASALLQDNVGVYIVGGKPRRDCAELVRNLGIKRLHFVEFCCKEVVDDYFRAADVFALATREDVWGLVVNEAMAKGLPVITTDGCVAGCEIIRNGENGYLIPCEAFTPLGDRIRLLIDDDEQREKIAQAGLDAVRGYTVEAMARAHVEAFLKE
jgi:glycosyltransferase involved in cell wall biosynthesis